jgi:hypothetical protein
VTRFSREAEYADVAENRPLKQRSASAQADVYACSLALRWRVTKSAGEGQPVKRTARMFDDRATPRSPFVVAYSPRSHPDTLTGSSLSSTLRIQFSISKTGVVMRFAY